MKWKKKKKTFLGYLGDIKKIRNGFIDSALACFVLWYQGQDTHGLIITSSRSPGPRVIDPSGCSDLHLSSQRDRSVDLHHRARTWYDKCKWETKTEHRSFPFFSFSPPTYSCLQGKPTHAADPPAIVSDLKRRPSPTSHWFTFFSGFRERRGVSLWALPAVLSYSGGHI